MRTYKEGDKVEYHPFENCGGNDIAKQGVIQEVLEGDDSGWYIVKYKWSNNRWSGPCRHHWSQLLEDTYTFRY